MLPFGSFAGVWNTCVPVAAFVTTKRSPVTGSTMNASALWGPSG